VNPLQLYDLEFARLTHEARVDALREAAQPSSAPGLRHAVAHWLVAFGRRREEEPQPVPSGQTAW
jgi:hypothetical protein